MSEGRCSELSLAAGEPLAGTATVTRSWLLVEVPGGWSRDVGSSDALPVAAREAVSGWLGRVPASRLLFLRRPGPAPAGHRVFVVTGGSGAIRRLELRSLDELGDLDLDAEGERFREKLVLVCGHGARDQCCALRGTAVYGALAGELGDEQLWISSHQGGHRFAANLLVLPDGLQLGRVDPSSAARIVGDALAGSIDLDHYRGCARYEANVQAAEIALRRALELERVDQLSLAGVKGDIVRFLDPGGREHVTRVEKTAGAVVPASCGADPEPQGAFAVTLG